MWRHMLLSRINEMYTTFVQSSLSLLGNSVGVWVNWMLALLDEDPPQNVLVNLQIAMDLWQGRWPDEKVHLPHLSLYKNSNASQVVPPGPPNSIMLQTR